MDPGPLLTRAQQGREQFLEELLTFLRFPTISTDTSHKADMRACAEWIREHLRSSGLQAKIMPTGGHPVLFADSGPVRDRPDAPTILMYGHYDVQPIGDASLWTSPAFEPEIRNGAIYARGAADDKGQVMTHLAATRCWKTAGIALPIRLKFLIEGEEELGSPHLPDFVRQHAEVLACDCVVLSDTSKHNAETPALTLSTRGLVYKELIVDGPSRDLHSGQFGGAVANPANVLARILASLHDDRQRVTIPGFYDDVLELSDAERAQMAAHGITNADLQARTGSAVPYGEAGYSNAERCSIRPTLDINGVWGGFTGEGSATIIPRRASAKVSMRLVAHQDHEKISASFDQAVRRACPPAVKLTVRDHASCGAYNAPADSPGMLAARQALEGGYGRAPLPVREGGTLPILPLFKEVLGADSVMLGFADPGCNLHSPDEFFHIRDLEIGAECVLRFHALSAQSPQQP